MQTLVRVQDTSVDFPRSWPQTVAEGLRAARVALANLRGALRDPRLVGERADVAPEPRMPPPDCVDRRPGIDDLLTHLDTGRQWPLRWEGVRLRQILEQQ